MNKATGQSVHIVGAGLSGLAAAVAATEAGHRVVLHESAKQAGGRCRSFEDAKTGRLIDNGSHLMLGAYHETLAYAHTIGGDKGLHIMDAAAFPFRDMADETSWTVRPSGGRLPWWVFFSERRIPGTSWISYLRDTWKLMGAGPSETVTDRINPNGPLFERLWRPLTLGVLNTPPEEASATLLWRALQRTLLAGERDCRAMIAHEGLGPALIDPAVRFLEKAGVEIRFGQRLESLDLSGGRAQRLDFGEKGVDVSGASVILALPAPIASAIVPDLTTPDRHNPIINIHYRTDGKALLPGGTAFLGLTGGMAQWLFVRNDVVSVTISAADDLIDLGADDIAAMIWNETQQAMGLSQTAIPPFRVIKERTATFAQTPEQVRRRPAPRTNWDNLYLAGDWTDTGLPASVEGAVLSGKTAAGLTTTGD
ncbi:MAG: hydroxysqualene dehydroxylase HpnE [Rhodospirillales bacterium]|nr:hydroxysqualene dehydroxylase HpnE [Rhodospirillales bacterium]MCW9038879.1 hydroxysqualene dehydroxylase HpnE [Rhodospirillales bacterium]